jgi:oxygen-independent coproporphyrinogen III oxidase
LAGIYLHIPYCKQACFYCDFHFSTNQKTRAAMLEAMLKEIQLRKNDLSEPIRTVYFGGGTPSILTKEELSALMGGLKQHFDILPEAEITLEANPDDLHEEKLVSLLKLGINRLSIGIQSFIDRDLKGMNRAHLAHEAIQSVRLAQTMGFSNISIDLMYGLPDLQAEEWKENLEQAIELDVQHVSAYCLTIEPKTVFGKWKKQQKLKEIDEELSAHQFEYMIDRLTAAGFEQYEVSNFAKIGYYSQHNSSYWLGTPYLGIGPGAHSYQADTRSFHVANNANYIAALTEGRLPLTIERLSREDQINEYFLTRLRTIWGCDLAELRQRYDFELTEVQEALIRSFQERKWLYKKENTLLLSASGRLLADEITLQLLS